METFEINQQLDPAMIITAYLIYLPIALLLTYYVARILFKNGKVFMIDIFRGSRRNCNGYESAFSKWDSIC